MDSYLSPHSAGKRSEGPFSEVLCGSEGVKDKGMGVRHIDHLRAIARAISSDDRWIDAAHMARVFRISSTSSSGEQHSSKDPLNVKGLTLSRDLSKARAF